MEVYLEFPAVMPHLTVNSSPGESLRTVCLQEDRHVVVSCLHSPDDVHSKFDPCPPCFFAVYDGHNGDLAAEIAKSKVMFRFRHARVKCHTSYFLCPIS